MVAVNINGFHIECEAKTSYIDLVRVPYPKAKDGAVFSVIRRPGNRELAPHIVSPGQDVVLTDGDRITVADTSNA